MEKDYLGRLKRTLSEKCPTCGSPLQLRAIEDVQMVKGIETTFEEEYVSCSMCDYEREVKDKKNKRKNIDKIADLSLTEGNNDRHNDRRSTKKNNGSGGRRSFKGNNRRGY